MQNVAPDLDLLFIGAIGCDFLLPLIVAKFGAWLNGKEKKRFDWKMFAKRLVIKLVVAGIIFMCFAIIAHFTNWETDFFSFAQKNVGVVELDKEAEAETKDVLLSFQTPTLEITSEPSQLVGAEVFYTDDSLIMRPKATPVSTTTPDLNPEPEEAPPSPYRYVTFGRYPQTTRDAEPIVWRVLSHGDGRIYLLSEYILDVRPFDADSQDWLESDVRVWLNGAFLRAAFSDGELALMRRNIDDDYVALPSAQELRNAEFGFSPHKEESDSRRAAIGTAYAYDQKLTWDNNYYTLTPRSTQWLEMIKSGGSFGYARFDRDNVGIRPVICLQEELCARFFGGEGVGTLDSPVRITP